MAQCHDKHQTIKQQQSNNKTATINTNNYDIQMIKLQTITNKQVIMT